MHGNKGVELMLVCFHGKLIITQAAFCSAAAMLLQRCCHYAAFLLPFCCLSAAFMLPYAVIRLSLCGHYAVIMLSLCCHAAAKMLPFCCYFAAIMSHAKDTSILLKSCCPTFVHAPAQRLADTLITILLPLGPSGNFGFQIFY